MENKYNETLLNEVCESILKQEYIEEHFGKHCEPYHFDGGRCAYTGEKCDPRPCGNCPQIFMANGHIMKIVLTSKLDFCEKFCPKYYSCDKVAEMNDKLKELED